MSTATAAATNTAERFHPRVSANLIVRVQAGRRSLVARARDLSMDGVYVHGPLPLPSHVTVSIPLPHGDEVTTRCEVARMGDDGVALRFESLDWDDLIALARYLHPRLP